MIYIKKVWRKSSLFYLFFLPQINTDSNDFFATNYTNYFSHADFADQADKSDLN